MIEIHDSSKPLPVNGIRCSSTSAGIYPNERLDLSLIELSPNTKTAAVFTKNAFCAAPVVIAKSHLDASEPKYLLINAGNANAGTGIAGQNDAISCCKTVSKYCNTRVNHILPFSTGVIGERLPVKKIQDKIPVLVESLDTGLLGNLAQAIITTDTIEKTISKKIIYNSNEITITGVAKGAGMIKPDMATMLAFIFTDAEISTDDLSDLLKQGVEQSFHRITVDGDTSTNDACLLSSTGESGVVVNNTNKELYEIFVSSLNDIFVWLAKAIIKDAEGATKFITINIKNGKSLDECLNIGFTIAHSPLVKTAFFASDPNWGRILAAIGRSDVDDLDIQVIDILLGNVPIITSGEIDKDYTEAKGQLVMKDEEIEISVNLNRGEYSTSVWTSDLSYDYVKINAEYRT